MRCRNLCLWVIVAAGLAACTTAPKAIRTPVAGPSVPAAVQNADQYIGEQVRWGGTIVEVENRRTETWIQVVARRLTRSGRPVDTTATTGRFLANVPGFLEPEEYRRGREITVVGTLIQSTTRNIGTYPYQFPVVRADEHYLWEPIPEYDPQLHWPYFWDPFYDPWWPYRPYYYFPRHPHTHRHR